MAFKLNPFTGKLDFYAKGAYQPFADPNVTTWAVASDLMYPAPAVPSAAAVAGQVLQDADGHVFQDDDGQVLQDS